MNTSKKSLTSRARATAAAAGAGLAVTALVGAVTIAPASAAHGHHHKHHHKHHGQFERRGVGVPAPNARRASRHAWGGWIGSWVTPDGQTVYHLDPRHQRGRAAFGPAVDTTALTYGRKAVDPSLQAQAAWILSRYGTVADAAQDAAVELAVDDRLIGGKLALDGATTKKRLARLDGPTRGNLLRLAAQMVSAAQQQMGPYTVHLTKSGASTASTTPVTVSVTSAGGTAVSRAQVSVTTSGGVTLSGLTSSNGGPVSFSVPRASTPSTQITATAAVPTTTLEVRKPTKKRLSRAAVAGLRNTVSAGATMTPPTSWTLTWQQYSQTVPASDTRTYQTHYTGTFQDSWTCHIPRGSTYCTSPAGDPCSQNVALNNGTWDLTYIPASGYRSGNSCVWRDYTQTGTYQAQTGGTYTPAQYGWVPSSASYADPNQAQSAYASCQQNTSSQRSCALSDNSSWSNR